MTTSSLCRRLILLALSIVGCVAATATAVPVVASYALVVNDGRRYTAPSVHVAPRFGPGGVYLFYEPGNRRARLWTRLDGPGEPDNAVIVESTEGWTDRLVYRADGDGASWASIMMEIEAPRPIDELLALAIARSYRATWIERGREVTMVDGGAEWLDLDHGHDVSPPPPFLTYALGWWSGMLALLTDGRIEILPE